MKISRKRTVLITTATVVLLGAGGAVWATAASADVQGGDRERASAAAVQAVGGGTVADVEKSDDNGEAYEVEVRKADGAEVEVALDKNFTVISQQAETPDAGERVLSAADRAAAEKAALSAVGGGTVTDVEAAGDSGGTVTAGEAAGDDGAAAYEVEVRLADGAEWSVDLGADFSVLRKAVDD
ncbi:PepSY domain-containing protein [Actinoplanes sp. NPDC051859]|uniref:PepSY domain-containing protein n=1 Tax=Actinoplanes sp. NPDC051859 TaxID=3363909 RepID=UPI0037B1F2EC